MKTRLYTYATWVVLAMLAVLAITIIWPTALARLAFVPGRLGNPLNWYTFVSYAFAQGRFLDCILAAIPILIFGHVVEPFLPGKAVVSMLASSAVLGAVALLIAGVEAPVIGGGSMVSACGVATICAWYLRRSSMPRWVKYWVLLVSVLFALTLLGGPVHSVALTCGGALPGLYTIAYLRLKSDGSQVDPEASRVQGE